MALTPAPSAQTLFGIDKDSQELVVYDTKDSATLLKVEKDTLKSCRSLTLAADLVDTRVYVCTPQVLIEFDSNFDFHTMEQLVADLLLNAELYGHKMYVDQVSDRAYAAPVKCVHSYDAVSRDVLARWAYPYTLDTHWHQHPSATAGEPADYVCSRGNTYKEASARLARSARLGSNCALGRGTTVGENSVLTQCVVGDGVTIGDNCSLRGCYIWGGVVVEDGVVASNAVLGGGCTLRAACKVGEGCMIGAGCAIGSGFELQPYARITSIPEQKAASEGSEDDGGSEDSEDSEDSVDEDTDDEAEADSLAAAELAREERAAKLASTAEPEPEPDTPQWSEEEVGAGGVGRLWTDGAEEQGARADGSNVLGFVPQRPRPGALQPESEEEEEAVAGDGQEEGEGGQFRAQMTDTLHARMAEGVAVETLLVELKSLRLSHNAGQGPPRQLARFH